MVGAPQPNPARTSSGNGLDGNDNAVHPVRNATSSRADLVSARWRSTAHRLPARARGSETRCAKVPGYQRTDELLRLKP
jgi:hypothetical protein